MLERIGEEEVNIASFAHDDEEEENDHNDNQEDEEGSIAHSTASASRSYTTQRSNPVGSNRYLSTTSPHGVRSTTHSYHGKSSRAVPLPKKKSPISKFQQISQQLDLDDTTEAPSMVFESDVSHFFPSHYRHPCT